MLDFKIHNAGYFTSAEHYFQKPQYLFLFFQTRGLKSFNTHNFSTGTPLPFIRIFFPGETFEFEFDNNRENWAVQFSTTGIVSVDNNNFAIIQNNEKVLIPRQKICEKRDLYYWSSKFSSLQKAFSSPTPLENFLAHLYLLDIFKYWIETIDKNKQLSPAAKLKAAIDSIENNKISLSELSRNCGYSTDHLRVLFKQQYDISPQEYRKRRIMNHAMELICNSSLTISDIADKCGFEHLSHFSSLFKKTHQLSPSAALKKFRYQKL